MKNLIIIGAGGMGRQVSLFAKACAGYQKEYVIKGFLDDNPNAMVGFEEFPTLLGSVDNYEIQPDDVFFNSIGDVAAKRKCINKILGRGGEFITLIHPTAGISEGAKIGKGCMIAARAGVGTETEIGDFCLIQDNAIIGHDVHVGNFCRIDCNVVLIAGVKLDDGVCIHTSSVINHNVHIGENAMVGALSFVIRNVKPGTSVQGNPAKHIIV
jgi:sugar O-acyltransferase (sialic acid O-acetyltransferase NeuD family)